MKTPVFESKGEVSNYISKQNGEWKILNPVDPEDNYADDWSDKTARAFFEWVRVVKHDLVDTITINEQAYLIGLQTSFGREYVTRQLDLKNNTPSYKAPEKVQTPMKPWGCYQSESRD